MLCRGYVYPKKGTMYIYIYACLAYLVINTEMHGQRNGKKTLVFASKEIGLEVNADNSKYMVMY